MPINNGPYGPCISIIYGALCANALLGVKHFARRHRARQSHEESFSEPVKTTTDILHKKIRILKLALSYPLYVVRRSTHAKGFPVAGTGCVVWHPNCCANPGTRAE